jgi:hypothetical protein
MGFQNLAYFRRSRTDIASLEVENLRYNKQSINSKYLSHQLALIINVQYASHLRLPLHTFHGSANASVQSEECRKLTG